MSAEVGDTSVAVASQRSPRRVPWQVKFGALSLIWGSSFLLMKVGLRALAPLQISGLRIFAGCGVLVLLLRLSGGRLPRRRRTWAHLAVSAVFLCTLPFSLFALGEERVPSALAAIGNSTTPVATVILGLLLLPGEPVGRRKLVGVVLGFVGVLILVQPWQSAGRPDLVGFGMTLVAGASYGLGWVYTRRRLAEGDLGGLSLPTAQLTVAAGQMVLVLGVWWLLHRDRFAAPWSLVLPPAPVGAAPVSAVAPIVAVLVLGVVGTGIAMSFQFDVVRAAGPTVGASVTYLIPVVSVALGVFVLAERLSWPEAVGAAVILCAAVLIQRPPHR